jgi:ubiquinone/menaquinone biosynthesis C-methylase UbiE
MARRVSARGITGPLRRPDLEPKDVLTHNRGDCGIMGAPGQLPIHWAESTMSDESLATGFPNVDASKRATLYSECLDLLDSLPDFQRYKARSYDLLELSAGLTVLDVGCGLGDDARRMADAVEPDGRVIGIDSSRRLLDEARARTSAMARLAFVRADGRALPFARASVDRCRIDRSLQHIPEPDRVIREMARVLRPGGRLVAYDNDWGTFAVSSTLRETTGIIQTRWCHAFTNSWIGRDLPRLFIDAGLRDVITEPNVSMIRDLELADRVYSLSETLARAVRDGVVSPSMAEAWSSEQASLSRAGGFLCSLTAYTVVGTK